MTLRPLLFAFVSAALVWACGTTTVRVVETEDPNDPGSSSGSSGKGGGGGGGGGGGNTSGSGGPIGSSGSSGSGQGDGGIKPNCTEDPLTCTADCVIFTPPAAKPNAAKVTGACSASQVESLVTACAKAPEDAACTTARSDIFNKSCAECIFGQKTDATVKMITLDPGGTPAARYNQAGCIDLVSGVSGCGNSYFTVVTCFDTYCANCTGSDETQCQKDIAQGPNAASQCGPYLLQQNCATALDTAEAKCFPLQQTDAAIQTLFRNMAAAFCQ